VFQASQRALLQSPLHHLGLTARSRPATAGDGVLLCEFTHLGYIVLRGKAGDAAFMAGAAGVLGAPPPGTPMTVLPCAAGVLLWVSPDEWLLVCRRSERDALLGALIAALAGVHAQVVDNSGGLTALRLAGPQHLRVLRHLGPYDFERLAVGRCVATVMSKTGVSVVRSDDAGVLLIVRRSFADYAWRLLERAARPYGLCITETQASTDPLFTPLLQPGPPPI
jgi:sarcosine oxidase subunit gamma